MAARIAAGERIVGWKVGLTSGAMQQMLGVDQPDYAAVLSGWLLEDGAAIPRADLIAPRVEAEIGFLLKRAAARPGRHGRRTCWRATAAVTPCIEVIDSRIRDWKIGARGHRRGHGVLRPRRGRRGRASRWTVWTCG